MTRKALITGIHGFTGRYLAAELHRAGYHVFGLGSTDRSNQCTEIQGIYTCDLSDTDRLARVIADVQPNVVAHLAAVSFVAHTDMDAIYRTNLIGSRNLLEALAENATESLQSILMASTAHVYGNATPGVIDEAAPLVPISDYAVSKVAMEYMARLYQDRLSITIVRPFNYTGVGQSEKFLLPKIIAHIKRKAPVIELGNLQIARDFSDVRVVAQYYRRLLENPAAIGQIFNVCSGSSLSLEEILATIRTLADYEFEICVNPAFVRQNEVKVLTGNPTKLHAIVGNISSITITDTLRWMVEGNA